MLFSFRPAALRAACCRSRRAALAALVLVIAVAPRALGDDDAPPVPAPVQLGNGLEVFVIEKHTVPLVTIEIAVRAGSFVEDRETNGLSHLYEHMFFKGNAALPTQEAYMKRMSELGITFNGTTSTERVNYFVTLPSKNLAAGAKFMGDALLSPLFNEEELVKERAVVIGEYDRNEASPGHYLHEGVRKALYGEDELKKNPLGKREIILRAKRETMVRFKERLYIPNNAALVIAGDVNPTEALSLAEKHFGPSVWARGEDPFAQPQPPLARLDRTKALVVTREKAPLVLAASWNGPDVSRDAPATFVADVWGTLCGQRQGRFQRTLVESGLTAGAMLSYQTQRQGGEVDFRASVLGDKVLETRDALLREVAAMAEPGYFAAEDLALAKRSLRVERAFEMESAEAASHTLTFWWASAGTDYYARYLDEVDKVTLEDVRAFVAKYLGGRPFVLACLAAEKKAKDLGLDEAKLMPAGPGAAPVDAKVLVLKNGVRVIARRDPSARVSALEVFVVGGSARLAPETQGAEMLALAVALEATKELPKPDLRRALESIGARLSHDSNYDFSRVGIAAPSDGFRTAVELLAQCLEKPLLDDASVKEKRDEMKTRLENEDANPDSRLPRLANEVFFAGHPYQNRPDGSLESVEKLDGAVVRKTLEAALRSTRLLLVTVSPFEHERVQELLEAKLGWVPKGDDEQAKVPPEFKPETRINFKKRDDIPTTYVLGKTAMPAPGSKDHAASKVLMTTLRRRLWDSIRSKYALSYAPSAALASYRSNYGIVYVSTTKPARSLEVMRDEVKRLKEELLTKDEIQASTAQETTHRLQQIEPAAAHATALGHAEIVSGSYLRAYDEAQELGLVTPEAVREAARKYLKGFVFGVIGKETVDPERLDVEPAKNGEKKGAREGD